MGCTLQIPETTEEEAVESAELDWIRDTSKWGGRMTREAFASSMFELADIWTENIDEEEVGIHKDPDTRYHCKYMLLFLATRAVPRIAPLFLSFLLWFNHATRAPCSTLPSCGSCWKRLPIPTSCRRASSQTERSNALSTPVYLRPMTKPIVPQ